MKFCIIVLSLIFFVDRLYGLQIPSPAPVQDVQKVTQAKIVPATEPVAKTISIQAKAMPKTVVQEPAVSAVAKTPASVVPVAKIAPKVAPVAVVPKAVVPKASAEPVQKIAPKAISNIHKTYPVSLYNLIVQNNSKQTARLTAITISYTLNATGKPSSVHTFTYQLPKPILIPSTKSHAFNAPIRIEVTLPVAWQTVPFDSIQLMHHGISAVMVSGNKVAINPIWLPGGIGPSRLFLTRSQGAWVLDKAAIRADEEMVNKQGTSLSTIEAIQGETSSGIQRITDNVNATVATVATNKAVLKK